MDFGLALKIMKDGGEVKRESRDTVYGLSREGGSRRSDVFYGVTPHGTRFKITKLTAASILAEDWTVA